MAQWLVQWTPIGAYYIVPVEFGYCILFGACQSKENHYETTRDKGTITYFQEHNLQ